MGCRHARGLLLAALFLLAGAHSASATAIAAVEFNGFAVRPQSGIDIGYTSEVIDQTTVVRGNASVSFGGSDRTLGSQGVAIAGHAEANPDGYAYGHYSMRVTVDITNSTGVDLDFADFYIAFSGFNPGGPEFGASVDNSAIEFARFASLQSGALLGEHHDCDTRIDGGIYDGYYVATPPSIACGVGAPDYNEVLFSFYDFAAGETRSMTHLLELTLEVSSVIPEPASGLLLLSALGGFARFRRAKVRPTRRASAEATLFGAAVAFLGGLKPRAACRGLARTA